MFLSLVRERDPSEARVALTPEGVHGLVEAGHEVVVETDGRIRIEVEDSSTDVPVLKAPSDEGGRGLLIVDWLCDRWGVHIVRDKKCVWCERGS